MVQAIASWQWYNWTVDRVPPGITPLRINFDETSCRLFYEAAPGILGSEPLATAAKKGYITQQVTRHQKRGALSLLALICDDTTVQATLPQVIIGNEHCLPERARRELVSDGVLMKNVKLLRKQSAWVTDTVLSEVVAIWGDALRASRLTHQPILLLDACPTHMGPRFLAACVRWNIWLVFVPAKTTWLIQPADTHCFASFKKYLRECFEDSLLSHENATVDIKSVIMHLDKTIRKVMQGKRWAPAFDANGWSKGQHQVRQKILDMLQCNSVTGLSSALPTLQQFQKIFPLGRDIPLAGLLNHYKRPRVPALQVPRPLIRRAQPEPLARPVAPWHGRLRSSSFLNAAPGEAAAAASSEGRQCAEDPPLPPPVAAPDTPTATLAAADTTARSHRVPVGRLMRRPRSMIVTAESASGIVEDEDRPTKQARSSS